MSKVIVERPRRPGYDNSTKRRGRTVDPDLMVSKEGMRAPHVRNYGGKELNENLAPLRRFIRSRVGQLWDDVYSEISQHLSVTNAVQQHVRDHLEDFVCVRTSMVNGEVWISGRWGQVKPVRDSWMEFYVDPCTGILCLNADRETWQHRQRREADARKAEEAAKIHVAGDSTEYRKVDGIWYEVKWDHVPPPLMVRYTDKVTGEVTQKSMVVSRTDVFTGRRHDKEGERYRSGQRQISREELRRNGLANG